VDDVQVLRSPCRKILITSFQIFFFLRMVNTLKLRLFRKNFPSKWTKMVFYLPLNNNINFRKLMSVINILYVLLLCKSREMKLWINELIVLAFFRIFITRLLKINRRRWDDFLKSSLIFIFSWKGILIKKSKELKENICSLMKDLSEMIQTDVTEI